MIRLRQDSFITVLDAVDANDPMEETIAEFFVFLFKKLHAARVRVHVTWYVFEINFFLQFHG